MRLTYNPFEPGSFPHGWTIYHCRWMVTIDTALLADSDTMEWAHRGILGFACHHIANKITIDLGTRLVLIDPIPDTETDSREEHLAVPRPGVIEKERDRVPTPAASTRTHIGGTFAVIAWAPASSPAHSAACLTAS